MPNISSLTMPDGIVYSIKDSIARKEIEEIKKNGSAGSGGSSGGGSFVIGGTVSGTTVTLDKTAGEIFAAMKKQNVVVVLEQPMEGFEEMVITFFMADAAPVNDAIYYTFRVAGGMQTVAATADAYPKMSLD